MRVLVLGGTGPMGSYLVRELVRLNYEVVVTSRKERLSNEKKLSYVVGDAKDDTFLKGVLKDNNYDAVVDFMLYTTDEFKLRYEIILKNTEQYLFLSSYRVYGRSAQEKMAEDFPRLLDTVEDDKYLQTDEYALAKARQEDFLLNSSYKNWTILRPAITYSKDRFFLGSAGTDGFLYRALKGKTIIFPKRILSKKTTMTWAGDAAKMIALIVGNKKSYGETINISTSESHTWMEVLEYYKKFLGVKVKLVDTEDYLKAYKLKYMMKYNRMYDRLIDNSKVISLTGIDQKDLMPLEYGLRMELAAFSRSPEYGAIDKKREAYIDKLTTTRLQKVRKKIKPRTRVRQLKTLAKSRIRFDGAIVTLTVYNNYGNVIQRYALQKFLMKNNYKFNMLDLHSGKVKKEHRQLKKFVDKYLQQDLFSPRLSKYYKSYIVGSDQVWRNFSVNKKWKNFSIQFLDFVSNKNTKRIAYAASFGVDTFEKADITDDLKKKIVPLMKRFDSISVREKSGIDMVNQLKGKKAHQVLDPTLLLKSQDYNKLIDQSKLKNKKSSPVFYYLIDPTQLIQSAISYYEGLTESKSDGVLPYLGPHRGEPLPSMEFWLKGIRDADIVVTDSYHAVVFSIIFHTDFVVFDKKGGGLARISELLEPLGLSDRIIIQGNKKNYTVKYKKINWSRVDKALDKKRKESSDWLLNALKDLK